MQLSQAVSAPYAEANMAAAEKTNPMNAESQMPGKEKSFLDNYIGGLAVASVKTMQPRTISCSGTW